MTTLPRIVSWKGFRYLKSASRSWKRNKQALRETRCLEADVAHRSSFGRDKCSRQPTIQLLDLRALTIQQPKDGQVFFRRSLASLIDGGCTVFRIASCMKSLSAKQILSRCCTMTTTFSPDLPTRGKSYSSPNSPSTTPLVAMPHTRAETRQSSKVKRRTRKCIGSGCGNRNRVK